MGNDVKARTRCRVLVAVMIAVIDPMGMISSEIKIDCLVRRYDDGKFPAIMLG